MTIPLMREEPGAWPSPSFETSDSSTIRARAPETGSAPPSDLIMEHLVPAGLWLVQLAAKLTDVSHHLAAVPPPPLSPALAAYLFQQTLTGVFTALTALLFLVRRPVLGRRGTLLGRALALLGTFVLYVPVSRPVVEDNPALLFLSAALIFVGMSISIASLLTLGRCFGLFPEVRGLVTRGPYRFVRHPLYLGEIIAGLGFAVGTASAAMYCLVALLCVFQYCRALLEERALSAVFPTYTEYRARTWRIFPGLH